MTEIAKLCEIAVVKIGAKGSLVKRNNEQYELKPYQSICRDTTGAGDLYASGFLHGFVNDYSLKTCGKLGSYLSSHIIKHIGPKFPESLWKEMTLDLNAIKKNN